MVCDLWPGSLIDQLCRRGTCRYIHRQAREAGDDFICHSYSLSGEKLYPRIL